MSIRPSLLKIIGQLGSKAHEFKSYPIRGFIERKVEEAKADVAARRLDDQAQERLEIKFKELLEIAERQVPIQNMYFVEPSVVQHKLKQTGKDQD